MVDAPIACEGIAACSPVNCFRAAVRHVCRRSTVPINRALGVSGPYFTGGEHE
jgi:hypothetical protein